MWTVKSFIYFLVASALGAFMRLGLGQILHAAGGDILLPWGVFAANILGCFFFGVFWVYFQHKKRDARAILVGFMGSFTTFSSYIFDIYMYIVAHDWAHVLIYGIGQIMLALWLIHLGITGAQCYFSRQKHI